jgi:hypothetical protein
LERAAIAAFGLAAAIAAFFHRSDAARAAFCNRSKFWSGPLHLQQFAIGAIAENAARNIVVFRFRLLQN